VRRGSCVTSGTGKGKKKKKKWKTANDCSSSHKRDPGVAVTKKKRVGLRPRLQRGKRRALLTSGGEGGGSRNGGEKKASMTLSNF